MPTKIWTQTVIGLFAGIIFLVSLITGQTVDHSLLRWASFASSTVILIVLLFERWAWRWPLIKNLVEMANKPIIHGTWKGEINFNKDKDGRSGTETFFLSVRQTFSSVQVFGYVPSSSSSSITASLKEDGNTNSLVYIYRSSAPYGKRDNNRPHEGTAILGIAGRPAREISGSYYTERNGGTGTIKLTEHLSSVATSYNDALRLFGN